LKNRKPIKSLKQTGRADPAIKHFIFCRGFLGSMLFGPAPSGRLALQNWVELGSDLRNLLVINI